MSNSSDHIDADHESQSDSNDLISQFFSEQGTEIPTDFRSGFVAIVGRPNVGKSTLMNHLLGQKLSITSRKPQRNPEVTGENAFTLIKRKETPAKGLP